MIPVLRLGMRVMLPSGNVVTLVRRDRTEWVCQYLPDWSRQRGEVVLSGLYLRKHGVLL